MPKIPARLFAIDYLARSSTNTPSLIKEFERQIVDATGNGDEELRIRALSLLATQHHPLLAERAEAQLGDADPAMRLLGLQFLRRDGSAKPVRALIPLLDDSEISVVTAATGLLGEWTGQKNELLELGEIVHRWKQWWGQHEIEFPKSQAISGPAPRPWRLSAPDFTLPDADDHPAKLSDYRSKVVLLGILNPVTGAGVPDLPTLRELQQRLSNEVTVVNVFVDTETIARTHRHVHGPNGECAAPVNDPAIAQAQHAKMQACVRALAKTNGINHVCLLDVDGAVARQFSAQALPTYVLIDRRGEIRRRFCGSRSEAAFSAMLKEITVSEPLVGAVSP